MALSNIRIQNYLKRINIKACPLCGGTNWTIEDKCYIAMELDEKLNTTSTGFPIAFIYCTNCGCCHTVAAKAAGLM